MPLISSMQPQSKLLSGVGSVNQYRTESAFSDVASTIQKNNINCLLLCILRTKIKKLDPKLSTKTLLNFVNLSPNFTEGEKVRNLTLTFDSSWPFESP